MPWDEVQPFIGRQHELKILEEHWQKARSGRPQAVAIQGPSGFGKTRLAQEFYSFLANNLDPDEGYWPRDIDGSQYRGRINPEIEIGDVSTGGRRELGRPPFLWWGLHLSAPEAKTGLQNSSLSLGLDDLIFHALAYEHGLRLRAKLKEMGAKATKGTVSGLVDAALNLMSGGLFSLLGVGKTVIETGVDIAGTDADAGTPDAYVKERDTLARRVIKLLRAICFDPPGKLPAIPVCIIIDEAQWAHGDKGLRRFAHELLQIAGSERWPLMVLAMSWTKEWSEGANRSSASETGNKNEDAGDADIELAELWQRPHHMNVHGVDFHELQLEKLGGMGRLLHKFLPGLTSSQSQIFLDRADGNPLFLNMLVAHALQARKFFEDRDTAKALTDKGKRYFRNVDYETMIAERLNDAPDNVRSVVGVGSTIGLQFSEELVVRMAIELAIDEPLSSLEIANRDYGFLVNTPNRHYEFRQNRYREVARKLFLLQEDEEELSQIQAEIKKDLLQKAAQGEIELSQIPLDLLIQPSLADHAAIRSWVETLAKIIYHALKRSDDTEFENLVSLFVQDGAPWLDALELEKCHAELGYQVTLLNIIWLMNAVNRLPDPALGQPFAEKLWTRFLSPEWLGRSETGSIWARSCQHICELLMEARGLKDMGPELACDIADAQLHYIDQALEIDPDNRTELLKDRARAGRLAAYQLAGREIEAATVFDEIYQAAQDLSPETLFALPCSRLRSTSDALVRRGEYFATVNRDHEHSLELFNNAEKYASAAIAKCGCGSSHYAMAFVREKQFGHFREQNDEKTCLRIYEDMKSNLARARSGNTDWHIDALHASAEMLMGHLHSNGPRIDREKGNGYYERAIELYDASLAAKPQSWLELNRAITQLSYGRNRFLQNDYPGWLEIGMPALDVLFAKFGGSAVDMPTSQNWFDNAINYAWQSADIERVESLIVRTAAAYTKHRHLICSPYSVFMAGAVLWRYGMVLGMRFLREKGRQATEADLEELQAMGAAQTQEMTQWVGPKIEELGVKLEDVQAFLANHTIPDFNERDG